MNKKQSWEDDFKKIKVYEVTIRSHYGVDLHDYSTFYTDSEGLKKINKKRSCYSHEEDVSSDLQSFEEMPLNTISQTSNPNQREGD